MNDDASARPGERANRDLSVGASFSGLVLHRTGMRIL